MIPYQLRAWFKGNYSSDERKESEIKISKLLDTILVTAAIGLTALAGLGAQKSSATRVLLTGCGFYGDCLPKIEGCIGQGESSCYEPGHGCCHP